MSLIVNPSCPLPFSGFNFQKQFTTTTTWCGYTMNYFLRLTINQLCNSNKSPPLSHIFILKHRERYDNQMCDDWNKWNHSGVAVSLEVKTFLFSCYIPDLFTVEKICELWFNNTHKQPFPPAYYTIIIT